MRVFKVLLLEDKADNAEIITRFLERYNFEVTHVPDALTGLVKVKNNRFNLILCDVMMPGIDGWRFLERAREAIGSTPVIMTTALSDPQSVLKGVSLEVAAYLVKPIRQAALMEKVLQALKIKSSDLIESPRRHFQLEASISGPTLKIALAGVPDADSAHKIQELVSRFQGSKLSELDIEIPREFSDFAQSIEFLERLVHSLANRFHIPADRTTLRGPLLEAERARESITRSAILGSCQQA